MRGRFGLGVVLVAMIGVVVFAAPLTSASARAPRGHRESSHRSRGHFFRHGHSGHGRSGPHGSRGHHHGHGHGGPSGPPRSSIAHVLLISVDGLHQSDLQWYVSTHPGSALADLASGGVEYTGAETPIPSDSFPGMTAQVTGGNPRTTGIYYDDEYSHAVLPAGTTTCHGQPTGGEVIYDSPDDKDATALDAGEGLTGLPASILEMTAAPQSLINPATLPVNPQTCKPIYPHEYLQVNTIFEVAHDHGLRTAWSDKHPAYEVLDGPSGNGVDDLFTPEIDSNALEANGTPYPGAIGWTEDNAATMQYDSYKVQAVLNEIDGFDHSGKTKVGVPAIFGMNFQTVSTAEKLLSSDGLKGGYEPGTSTPGPLLARALDYINAKLQAMDEAIQAQGLARSTAIIVSAKHGQSPQDPNSLVRIKDGPIIEAINKAWETAHPSSGALIVAGTDDDAWQSYLSDTSQEAADFVKDYLWSHTATGVAYDGSSRTLEHSGLAEIFAGKGAAKYFGVPLNDPRHPDVWGVVQVGVVYTGGSKIAEHGGANPADRDVPIVVFAPGVTPNVVNGPVETTQIAPTILSLLGLDPDALEAVRIEGTPQLPGS